MHLIAWLNCMMAVAISVSLAFTIDTTAPDVYTTEENDLFRNKVLQIITGKDRRILDTASNQINGSEETCQSDLKQTHRCIVIPDISLANSTIPVDHFGLSIANDSIGSQFTVCSPGVAHESDENCNLRRVCYKMMDHSQQTSSFTAAFQDCTKSTVDLVFLFDGSGSMTEAEFNTNKHFIVDIMNSLRNTSIKFAAVQFSYDYNKVFDFNDYQAGRAFGKLMKERHMKSLTNTYKALEFVLEEIFDNPGAGASPDATKVMMLITDGDPSDEDGRQIIKRYDDKNIIRFVIEVKPVRKEEIMAIASEKVLRIQDYNGLMEVLELFRQKIQNIEEAQVTHRGLSVIFYEVCSPDVAQKCDRNFYLNSVCYKMTDHPQQVSSTPAFQERTKMAVDLVFLFDGSGSLTEAEFNKNKDFIVDIMNSLRNTSIKFAAVQFSYDYNKVFDFSDYQAGRAFGKLRKERHMKSLTHTYKALEFVLGEMFDNPGAGASPDATKVLLLITDGDATDKDDTQIIKRYDDKNVTRFVIGVKNVMLEKLMIFASEPKDKNVFKIENYSGLTGLLEMFQTKISKVEGDVTNKMSQRGFSAVFSKENLILGSVGSNSWRSLLQDCLEDSHMQKGSYRGYSTSVGKNNNAALYFTGAPRFEHTGRVVLFRHDDKNWTAAQTINGEQIGSYFGAELCSVDINSDGNTDFLLVGAPLFYQPQEKREGRIYIYKLTDEMRLERGLDLSAPSVGRFGTTISSLADLNGDGLRDVAVGAPLEDDNRGAVYIFLGDRHSGIRSTFSQRISGQQIKPELRFFGQAIDGDIHLGEDVPPNIVVGSQGVAVVLRSRPVFNVTAHLFSQPAEISTDIMNCRGNTDESLPVFTLRGCFEMVETTKSKAGTTNSGLQISYVLDVDPLRETNRGFFSQTDKKARNVTSTYELRDKHTCFSYPVYMPTCVDDTVSPISIRLKFFQVDSESASTVLDLDSETQAVVEVPFQK